MHSLKDSIKYMFFNDWYEQRGTPSLHFCIIFLFSPFVAPFWRLCTFFRISKYCGCFSFLVFFLIIDAYLQFGLWRYDMHIFEKLMEISNQWMWQKVDISVIEIWNIISFSTENLQILHLVMENICLV